MRRYEREDFRHLSDAERYRDYDYLANDAWVGPNERVPHGMTRADEPPWSTLGGWETRPFAAERAWDEDRGQGRQYGRDLGLGFGRPHDPRDHERSRDDDYDRGYQAEEQPRPAAQGPRANGARPSAEPPRRRRGITAALAAVARPFAALRQPLERLTRAVGTVARRRPRRAKHHERPDQRIFEDVCDRLTAHPDVDATEIVVKVTNGEVSLIGEVSDRRTKYLVEDVADDVLGVRLVKNELRIATRARQRSTGTSVGTTTAAVRR